MPRPKTNGAFIMNMQRHAANAMEGKRKSKEVNKHGSWWVGVDRDKWGEKCAEVFPDLANSKEGQKPFRPWKSGGA